MTALWAYTGSPSSRIDRHVSAVLAHRGHIDAGRADVGSQRAGVRPSGVSLRVALPRDDARLGGVAADGEFAVAVGGRLGDGLTAGDLLERHRSGGVQALQVTPGDWIIAATDGSTLSILRDPAGVRSVYWSRIDGRVVVGIEPKAIWTLPEFRPRLDVGAVAQFLTFSFVPGERSALDGLCEVPAGHRLDIDLATLRTSLVRWFFHEHHEIETARRDRTLDEGDADVEGHVARIRQVVDDAVATRLPEEPTTAFLSGGLDSSVVVAAAVDLARERGSALPETFSLSFGSDIPNELEFAAAMARRAGTTHHELEVTGRDVASSLRALVWHLDEPIGDPVTAGNFALARAASRIAPWVLNGEGGDPVFGGPKNLPMLLAQWYPTLDESGGREDRYLASWRRAGDEVERLLHPDLRSSFDRERDLVDVVRPYISADRPRHFLNKLMVANMRMKGAHLILPKVERMVGAAGMTPLSPLFDPEVVAASMAIPPNLKLRDGVEKWVLKEAYRDLVPSSIIERPKSGMRVPVRLWFQDELRREARRLLSPRSVARAGVFDPRRVKDVLRYRTGRDGLRLWMLVTFELWRRMVFDGERPPGVA